MEPTIAKFEDNISRWLKAGPLTTDLAYQINATTPLDIQLRGATCDLPDEFLNELLAKGVASCWGNMKAVPKNSMFVGNVFLHPEEEKKRWRLIYHPLAFNAEVRRRRLHSVRLPRMRSIVRIVSKYEYTVKVDLKCAFFQIPLEQGIFVFRKGKELYTLNRLLVVKM